MRNIHKTQTLTISGFPIRENNNSSSANQLHTHPLFFGDTGHRLFDTDSELDRAPAEKLRFASHVYII